METRIALAACVVIGCALCGKAVADAAGRRAAALASLAEGVRVLRIHMTGMLEPVARALERSGCPLMSSVGGEMRDGCSAGAAWKRIRRGAARRGGPADAMSAQDLQVLDTLFDGLGQSGREEQEALLRASLETVERLRDAARKRAAESERLYPTLGLLVGLMLALTAI